MHKGSTDERLPDNCPIIVGAGQYMEQPAGRDEAALSSPMDLVARAARGALADAGIDPVEVDTIGVIRLFADAAKAWHSPFGGSNNPPESIARRIGATPQQRIYSNAGGTEPLVLMMELLQDIARGGKDIVLLAGGEAIANQRHALRQGLVLDWLEEYDQPLDNRKYVKRFASPQELSSELGLPAHYYALIENAQAATLGHSPERHIKYMANLLAPLSAVAADNPLAQFPTALTPDQIASSANGNYPISLPYLKNMIAQDAVNQAAALVLTSVGHAKRLGINPEQWTVVQAYAQGEDCYLSQRADPGRSVAMDRVLGSVMSQAAADAREIDLIDIYSCFPCAVQAACDALHLPVDGSRTLTLTGGLPYFGGPGNNYSMHALAEAAMRLRGTASRALISANGGVLSKHAAAVLTAAGQNEVANDWGNQSLVSIIPDNIKSLPYATAPEAARVTTYTVIHQRDKDDIGIVLAETAGGERLIASSAAAITTAAMSADSPVGRNIRLHSEGERLSFEFCA